MDWPPPLLVSARVLWARGVDDTWGERLRLARRNLSRTVIAGFGLGLVVFAGTGALLGAFSLLVAAGLVLAS